MEVTPSGTHCWICGAGPIAAGYPVCPCTMCQACYEKTGSYLKKPDVWKPDETPKTDAS